MDIVFIGALLAFFAATAAFALACDRLGGKQ